MGLSPNESFTTSSKRNRVCFSRRNKKDSFLCLHAIHRFEDWRCWADRQGFSLFACCGVRLKKTLLARHRTLFLVNSNGITVAEEARTTQCPENHRAERCATASQGYQMTASHRGVGRAGGHGVMAVRTL